MNKKKELRNRNTVIVDNFSRVVEIQKLVDIKPNLKA